MLRFVCGALVFIVSFTLSCPGRPLSSIINSLTPRQQLGATVQRYKEKYCNPSCLHNISGPQTATLASHLQINSDIIKAEISQRTFAMSYPTTHRTVTVVEKGKVSIQEKQLPVLGEENILVRVRSVALNPADWKVC